MSIYVDSLFQINQMKKGKIAKQCHLFGDNINELHSIAMRLGVKRILSRTFRGIPIYDINERQRKMAINIGAENVETHEAKIIMTDIKFDLETLEENYA